MVAVMGRTLLTNSPSPQPMLSLVVCEHAPSPVGPRPMPGLPLPGSPKAHREGVVAKGQGDHAHTAPPQRTDPVYTLCQSAARAQPRKRGIQRAGNARVQARPE